jgi:uncharacterized protein
LSDWWDDERPFDGDTQRRDPVAPPPWVAAGDGSPERPADSATGRSRRQSGRHRGGATAPASRRTRDGRRLSPAGGVLLAVLIGLGLALFLNAPGLKKSAQSLPYGARRSVAVAFATPIAAVSHFIYLDRPGQWARSALGKGGAAEEKGAEDRLADLGKPTDGATPGVLRTPTRKKPLRVWVGGDSMTQVFGRALVDDMRDTRLMKATLDYRISTGLSRPDFFDWPRHLRYEVDKLRPEAIVIMFGANDGQDVEYEGKVLKFGTPAWKRLYHTRVGEAMDIAMNEGFTKVYWVGQPIVRSDEFSRVLADMNGIYAAEAAKRPQLTYIPTWDLFADKDGRYADYLRDAEGRLVLMRQEDGIHLSLEGGDRLSVHILDIVEHDFKTDR